jgi:hypothetical protein
MPVDADSDAAHGLPCLAGRARLLDNCSASTTHPPSVIRSSTLSRSNMMHSAILALTPHSQLCPPRARAPSTLPRTTHFLPSSLTMHFLPPLCRVRTASFLCSTPSSCACASRYPRPRP